MDIDIKPGHYVVAVSGGVDSVVLLNLLASKRGVGLTVAHFDHGIRSDSEKDRVFVQKLAEKFGLPFVYNEGKLGPKASEEKAREARYKFLRRVQKASGADAIITAHHQDDLLETAVINLLRGTGRSGLSSLKDKTDTKRPLLKIPKNKLIEYAKKHGLDWREDPTNKDTKYLRNYVRHEIIPRFTVDQRQEMLAHIEKASIVNKDIENILSGALDRDKLNRQWFIMLSHDTAKEVCAAWLRHHGIRKFDRKLLSKLVTDAKTLRPGKQMDVNLEYFIEVGKEELALKHRER